MPTTDGFGEFATFPHLRSPLQRREREPPQSHRSHGRVNTLPYSRVIYS